MSTLQPPTGLGLSSSCPGATVTATWTASTSAYATGYTLVRKSGGTVQNTINVSGGSTVTQNDTNVANGSYTYELNSVYSNWTSSVATANTTVSCPPQPANAGFETGTMSSWTCTGGTPTVVTSPVHGGTYAAQIVGGGSTVQCSQVISGLTTSHGYTFSMWINSSGSAGSVGYILGGTNSSSGGSGAGWIQKTISFTTGPSNTSVTVYFSTSGTVTFDDGVLS
jgi:chitinase